jgi:hypothetical protein
MKLTKHDMYYKTLREKSDALCAEYGLSVIENPGKPKNRYMEQLEKRGEPTAWNVIRSDINEAIRQSMTEKQFIWKMKQWGYSFNFNPNRKYPTIRAPGAARVVRLKTLGDDYAPDSINNRILENRIPYIPPPFVARNQYRYKGKYSSIKSASGVYVTYLIVSLILQKIFNLNKTPNNPQRVRYTPELRQAIRHIQRYSQKTRLLCRHKIETAEQLQGLIDKMNEGKYGLIKERERVYNRMKYAKTPAILAELKSVRDDLSAKLKVIRTDLFLLRDVQKEYKDIKSKLLTQRELSSRFIENEKSKSKTQNNMKDRGYAK